MRKDPVADPFVDVMAPCGVVHSEPAEVSESFGNRHAACQPTGQADPRRGSQINGLERTVLT